MINDLPLEPPTYGEEQQLTFLIINQVDPNRVDLRDPIESAIEVEEEYGPLVEAPMK
jgi:hypothetical protein